MRTTAPRGTRRAARTSSALVAMTALLLAALLLAAGASGASPPEEQPANHRIAVERPPSGPYEIGRVLVQQSDGAIRILGSVHHWTWRRGAVPGQVHLTLLGPQGETLAETETAPLRRNRQARAAHFQARLMADPPLGSRLQVTHQPGS